MSTKVGEHLRHDPIKLRFTTTHAANGTAKAILKRSLNQSIAEIIAPAYATPSTTVILYEKLDVSIVELETKRSLKVTWTGSHNKEESTHSFLLPKTSMVHDLTEHLGRQAKLTPGGTGKIRVFEVSKDGKTQKEFTGSEMIGNIPDPVELFAEVRGEMRGRGENGEGEGLLLRFRPPLCSPYHFPVIQSLCYSLFLLAWVLIFRCRKYPGKSWKQMMLTRSSACSTFRRKSREHMVFLSD